MGKRYTQAEREQVNAKRDLLVQAAKIVEEERAADIDAAARILSTYSRRNIALILIQAEQRGQQFPQAVAGFHAWRDAGRMVRKGSAGYFIYAPVMGKDAEGEDVRKGYTVRHVFDVVDTDPIAADSPATLRELIAS
jgi:hypothetical protein